MTKSFKKIFWESYMLFLAAFVGALVSWAIQTLFENQQVKNITFHFYITMAIIFALGLFGTWMYSKHS